MTQMIRKQISWYTRKIRRGKPFAVAGYSDAEWFCIMGFREGEKTGLGQVISKEHGQLLLEILHRRLHDKTFIVAVPGCIWDIPAFRYQSGLKTSLEMWGLGDLVFYERDMVTDDLACQGGLYPFISEIRRHKTTIIGPAELRGLDFLDYDDFVEIPTPNLHLEPDKIDIAVNQARLCGEGLVLVSAGVSAAVIIDKLHGTIGNSQVIDCGSIWDAFVGIGGQRQWRADLYSSPQKLEAWKRSNLREIYKSRD